MPPESVLWGGPLGQQNVPNPTRSHAPRRKPIPKRVARPAKRGFLVAVGASAGGLKSLGKLLAGLPANFAAPIVAVIHLDPSHQSQIASILQRETRLRVQEAKSGQRLVAGSVYVARPDRHLEVRGNTIALTRGARVRFSRPSIDHLFTSVAGAYGNRAVAVVLSGTGSDGSVGVARIHAEGGLALAEDTKTAEFASMPQNAVNTGCIDAELPVDGIPSVIVRALSQNLAVVPPQWPLVLSLLRERYGTDFSGYRPATLLRRLQRRILATGHANLQSYLNFARKDVNEVQRLHSEFLIKVSEFFRDPKEWEQLSRKVIRPMIRRRLASDEFRIWSAGCATGEEAYSLAILFSEALEGKHPGRFKVFATDLDEPALAAARRGVYKAGQLTRLSKRRLNQYFDRDGDQWRVKKPIRSRVIFGRHDVLRDPPLASIDLLVCRNVLIYFTPEQSQTALRRLLYSLKPGGFLFLGRSEGRRKVGSGIESVSGSSRIWHRLPAQLQLGSRVALRPGLTSERDLPSGPPSGVPAMSHQVAFRNLLLEAATVVLFGVDAARKTILWNRAAESFFGVNAPEVLGKPISDALGAQFWDDLKESVQEAGAGQGAARATRLAHQSPGLQPRYLDVDWIRFRDAGQSTEGILFVAVEAIEGREKGASPNDLVVSTRRTARWTMEATEELQAANEELETLNEELQSTSEEQQTLNEELESRNEELETVNEELQSLNEELSTLNEEVGVRVSEADRLAAYLRTILDLAPNSVIGCDLRNRIAFWNEVAARDFRMSEAQVVGKDLFKILPALDVPAVRKMVQAQSGKPQVRVSKGPVNPGWLDLRLGVVRDQAGRRKGYCLRVLEEASNRKPSPGKKGKRGRGHGMT